MSRFYVGQRVRILRSVSWPELDGSAGTVIDRIDDCDDPGCEWEVSPDVWGSSEAPYPETSERCGFFCPNSSQIEPLTDPGREVVEWSECLWQPEHLHVNA